MRFNELSRLIHTLRYVRPIQIANRIQRRLIRPQPASGPAPPTRLLTGRWLPTAQRAASLVGPNRLRVFQHEIDLDSRGIWNNESHAHLVRYNLHYFDDLSARHATERCTWHRELMSRWIAENPPSQGTGWEPYPTSIRIVNWIKWALAGNQLTPGAVDSLATQARSLASRIEYHLLANHLLANAKALIFAGAFFDGAEAERWLRAGLRLLRNEIDEQILDDGGHFELSPMYHSIILDDLLDLTNLACAYPTMPALNWVKSQHETVDRMRDWLITMCHPDGEISFFNDAAMGIAACPFELEQYALRLGFRPATTPSNTLTHLSASGYLRVQFDEHVALLDVARVGPDYQPGHAHADTLSFEWSLREARTVVNSGTSCYGVSSERERERATRAHNTVEVDGENSSEVWHGFRVARRARPTDLEIREDAKTITIACSHTGYRRLPGRVTHRRTWEIGPAGLIVSDALSGRFQSAIARVHFHPQWTLEAAEEARFSAKNASSRVQIQTSQPSQIREATYHPAFEVAHRTSVIESAGPQAHRWSRFTWSP